MDGGHTVHSCHSRDPSLTPEFPLWLALGNKSAFGERYLKTNRHICEILGNLSL